VTLEWRLRASLDLQLAEEPAPIENGIANDGARQSDSSAPTGLLVLSFITVYLLWAERFLR